MNVVRRSLKVVTAVAAGVLLSACGAKDGAAPPGASGPSNAAPTSQTQQPPAQQTQGGETKTEAPGDKADNPDLRFPNTSQTVLLIGYNDKTKMVEFKTQRWVSAGESAGHLDDVAGDTGTHRLALTDDVTVRSALSICPSDQPVIDDQGLGDQKCTKDRLIAGLREGENFKAKIDVDGSDRISKVAEIYTP